MLRMGFFFLVFQFLVVGAACACQGQSGQVIFQDKFTDANGGWQFGNDAFVKTSGLVFAFKKNYSNSGVQNLTFHATSADFCVQMILPKPIGTDNYPAAGIEFWAKDFNNTMLLQLRGNGDLSLYGRTNGNWQTIFEVPKAPEFRSAPGAVNTLRVNTVGGKITAYLNGKMIRFVRAQVPNGNQRFGIYAQFDKTAASYPVIKIKSFEVTSGQ